MAASFIIFKNETDSDDIIECNSIENLMIKLEEIVTMKNYKDIKIGCFSQSLNYVNSMVPGMYLFNNNCMELRCTTNNKYS